MSFGLTFINEKRDYRGKERLGFNVNRSSRLQMFFKINVLKNFANFYSLKTPLLKYLFNKVAWPDDLLKRCFLVKFTNSSKTCFFTEHL